MPASTTYFQRDFLLRIYTHQWMMEEQRFDFPPLLFVHRMCFRYAATGQINIFHAKRSDGIWISFPERKMTAPSAQGVFDPREALQSDIKRHAPCALYIFYCQKRQRDGILFRKNACANAFSWEEKSAAKWSLQSGWKSCYLYLEATASNLNFCVLFTEQVIPPL